ncbi:hypothetical protein J6590_041135 [Homalodisca vitripennis]|nr:hypothetical protein J6590_041135 [Homalodisca vitripennis]
MSNNLTVFTHPCAVINPTRVKSVSTDHIISYSGSDTSSLCNERARWLTTCPTISHCLHIPAQLSTLLIERLYIAPLSLTSSKTPR